MHLIQLRRPLQRAAVSGCQQLTPLVRTSSFTERFAKLRLDVASGNAAVEGRRYASVKAQGAYRLTNKKTIPKKLGAKKTGDQYVIPGNIIYKQRGTIWHAGENTIIGRDHTIHAAVAGYVKYYRDPQRHPKRQYIGVVFDKADRLPYPVGAPRKRKVGLVAGPRKEIAPVEPTAIGPSGIPLMVTRHQQTQVSETPSTVTATATSVEVTEPAGETPRTFKDGNSVIAALMEEKLRARKLYDAKRRELRAKREEELRERQGTRVFRLQDNYAYRETNWEIGRLVGDAGVVQGTENTSSRKRKFRNRRRRRNTVYSTIKQNALEKVERRDEYRKFVVAKRLQRAAHEAEIKAKMAKGEKVAMDGKTKKTDGKAKDKKVKA
ncbi:ribosomal L27 protein-domain-containing protein [Cercophora newfieldiana]|uniref:Large ribosomal subunit protein bL27m n=1 Tax=Cercophora newfieldiana TaxID=92897 RepID=A0AA39XRV6_9PEZI|nr:ribosomal L27 protein-domain-containing protein [Cercophora newfieldiana]